MKDIWLLNSPYENILFFNSLDSPLVTKAGLGVNFLMKETLSKKLLSSLTMICLFMVDIVVALVGSMKRSILGKGNLSFGCALFNLKEFTSINLHIFQ